MLVVRPAKTNDVKAIRALVDSYAAPGQMLTKETVTLYESVQEFVVAEVDGVVVGCGALHILWEDLAEVRTMAVKKELNRQGIGHKILGHLRKASQYFCEVVAGHLRHSFQLSRGLLKRLQLLLDEQLRSCLFRLY